jgi:hypothetical protein
VIQWRRVPSASARHDGGAVLVVFALSLSVLVGCVALVVGIGDLVQIATNEQDAADAAALSAAGALGSSPTSCPGGPLGCAEAMAAEVAAGYGFSNLSGCSMAPPAGFVVDPRTPCLAVDSLVTPRVVWVGIPGASVPVLLSAVLSLSGRSAVAFVPSRPGRPLDAQLCTTSGALDATSVLGKGTSGNC